MKYRKNSTYKFLILNLLSGVLVYWYIGGLVEWCIGILVIGYWLLVKPCPSAL